MAVLPGSMSALEGLAILVTRPRASAQKLAQEITAHGGEPMLCPALEIDQPEDQQIARATLQRLQDFSVAIFVSVNAVEFALAMAPGIEQVLSSMATLAVGEATGRRLIEAGIEHALWPRVDHSSEGLLALPELQDSQIADKRVLVVRGEGGRETLAEALRSRAAVVEYAEVYRRVRAATDLGALQKSPPDIIIATSTEVLDALVEMFAEIVEIGLLEKPVVVPGARVHAHAIGCGFSGPVLTAASAREGDLVAAALAWAGGSEH